jgi:hypothetical protein
VRGKIVNRTNNLFAFREFVQVLTEEFGIERIRMIEVGTGALFQRQVREIEIVGVQGEDCGGEGLGKAASYSGLA